MSLSFYVYIWEMYTPYDNGDDHNHVVGVRLCP
jgi:hypothetical protein